MSNKRSFFSKDKHETALLIDPDKFNGDFKEKLPAILKELSPSYFFVGGSFLSNQRTTEVIRYLKRCFSLPVILFPGDYAQLVPHADAVLFLSLLSGRKPEYLAAQQVKAAPLLKQWQLRVLPTAYILIEGNKTTTVQYITQTLPVPRDKTDLVLATALAGQYMGMQLIYLEAGSGAHLPIPLETVRAVSEEISLPLIVGGGIKPSMEKDYFDAGANVVVMGTFFE